MSPYILWLLQNPKWIKKDVNNTDEPRSNSCNHFSFSLVTSVKICHAGQAVKIFALVIYSFVLNKKNPECVIMENMSFHSVTAGFFSCFTVNSILSVCALDIFVMSHILLVGPAS